jgi:hypothetical protein
MAGGGFRPREGRPHGSKYQARHPRRKVGPLSPLEYALQVINDPEADPMPSHVAGSAHTGANWRGRRCANRSFPDPGRLRRSSGRCRNV